MKQLVAGAWGLPDGTRGGLPGDQPNAGKGVKPATTVALSGSATDWLCGLLFAPKLLHFTMTQLE